MTTPYPTKDEALAAVSRGERLPDDVARMYRIFQRPLPAAATEDPPRVLDASTNQDTGYDGTEPAAVMGRRRLSQTG
jgi:hypothetical protein